MTIAGQAIVNLLRDLDRDTNHAHAGRIHDLINRVVMLDADDQGAWDQAQSANRKLDGVRAWMRTLEQGYENALRRLE